jgi:hypothetical protein
MSPSVSAKLVLREHAVVGVLGGLDREADALHHRLEKPTERGLLVTNVFFEFIATSSSNQPKVVPGSGIAVMDEHHGS